MFDDQITNSDLLIPKLSDDEVNALLRSIAAEQQGLDAVYDSTSLITRTNVHTPNKGVK